MNTTPFPSPNQGTTDQHKKLQPAGLDAKALSEHEEETWWDILTPAPCGGRLSSSHVADIDNPVSLPGQALKSLTILALNVNNLNGLTAQVALNDEVRRQKAIKDITDRLSALGYSKCATRIEFLQNCDDFEEGEEKLSLGSVRAFVSFASETGFRNDFRYLGEPLLGLSSNGVLGATWRIANDRHLYIQFHSSHSISFAMIGPNPALSGDGRFHLSGRNTCTEVIKTLREQGVTEWRVK